MENPIYVGGDGGETCPDCDGEGQHEGIGCLAPGPGRGCRPVTIVCTLCRGAGRISAEQADWYRTGQYMRRCRLSRDNTLRKEAELRGMHAANLADMEHGRIRPAPCAEDGGE